MRTVFNCVLVFFVNSNLTLLWQRLLSYHCMKSVQIRSNFWSVFSRTRTEYREIRSISVIIPNSERYEVSLYSVQMRENTDQKLLRIWTLFTQSPLICSENQWNGFYMITTSVMKELNVISEIYFHVLKTGKGRKNLRCNLLETCFVFDIFKLV